MAAKQNAGDALASNLAGMSKSQLYDIMSQMKSLIEQNQQQARQILVDNPLLTRALFQAQIMLGMVQPPQAVPTIQLQAPQPSKPIQQPNTHSVHSTPSQATLPDQPNVSQAQVAIRKQHQNQSSMPMSSNPGPGFHSQPVPSQLGEPPRAHLNTQTTQMGHLHSSQVPSMPPLPVHSGSQPPSVVHQAPMPPVPSRLQQPMQTSSATHHVLQPPLPPQPRPPMQVPFQPPMPPNMNFPNAGIPQMPHSQPMFHPSSRPPSGMGPSFPQGQPPLPNQPPHQPLYQGGGPDFSNHSGGNSGQMGTPPWPPISRENMGGPPHLGPLPSGPGQMPLSNHPPRPAPLSPEMEKQLLQQVMSLTQEQINLLPPDQRNQVLQLQQMLRQ